MIRGNYSLHNAPRSFTIRARTGFADDGIPRPSNAQFGLSDEILSDNSNVDVLISLKGYRSKRYPLQGGDPLDRTFPNTDFDLCNLLFDC